MTSDTKDDDDNWWSKAVAEMESEVDTVIEDDAPLVPTIKRVRRPRGGGYIFPAAKTGTSTSVKRASSTASPIRGAEATVMIVDELSEEPAKNDGPQGPDPEKYPEAGSW